MRRATTCTLSGLTLMLVALSTAPVADAKDAAAGKRVWVQVRVQIDPEGRVTDARMAREYGPGLTAAALENARALRFVPPRKDGLPVGGATWVTLAGCAMPVEGGMRLSFNYSGHGPLNRGPMTPVFPSGAARNGNEGRFTVNYQVQPDGTARLEELDVEKGGVSANRSLGPAVRTWIDKVRFEPEELDGQPIATRSSYKVGFGVGDRPSYLSQDPFKCSGPEPAKVKDPTAEKGNDSPFEVVPAT